MLGKKINKISKKVCIIAVQLGESSAVSPHFRSALTLRNVDFVFVCSVNRENGFVYFYDLIITTSAAECDYEYYCSSHFTFLPIETLLILLLSFRISHFAIYNFRFLFLFCVTFVLRLFYFGFV